MRSVIEPAEIRSFVTRLLHPVMHFKRAYSIGLAVDGAMHADRLSVAAVGRALARQSGITPKSGIKQVDRLLSNPQFDVEATFHQTVPWIVGRRKQIVVAMDWTEYPEDGHSRVAINLVTKHGRATPLVWKTVETRRLKRRRNRYEDEVLRLLASALPDDVEVILLADRGFGDTKLYQYLRDELGWDFVIRFRAAILVEDEAGEGRSAADWIPPNGQIREISGACVTKGRFPVGVVCVKRRGMKEAWCLATTLEGQKGRVVELYSRRFTCEENFRDEKDRRYGFGFVETSIGCTHRRDRFLVIAMLATLLLTLLGGAGEQVGCDRQLRANTVKRRTHSLVRQGGEYLSGCAQRWVEALRRAFLRLLGAHPRETAVYALL